MQLSRALELFTNYASEKYRPRTIEVYMGHLKAFLKHTGDKPVEEISLFDDIISYSQHLKRKGRQPATINLCMSSLRQLWTLLFMIERQSNIRLPFPPQAIPIRKVTVTRSHRAIKEEHYKQMMQAVDTASVRPFLKVRDRAIFALLYDTGMRINELTGLNIDQLDVERRSLNVLTEKRRDTNKKREVYWTLPTHYYLTQYLQVRKDLTSSDELFINSRNLGRIHARSVQRNLKIYLKEAGIDPSLYSPHSFRHGVGMRGASKQMYPPLLQQYLGHRSPANTQVYYNLQNEDLRREWMSKLGDRSIEDLVENALGKPEHANR